MRSESLAPHMWVGGREVHALLSPSVAAEMRQGLPGAFWLCSQFCGRQSASLAPLLPEARQSEAWCVGLRRSTLSLWRLGAIRMAEPVMGEGFWPFQMNLHKAGAKHPGR